MQSLLDRYRGGEHERVWAELLELGTEVRAEPAFTDAKAVAHETMHRVRANIEMLIPRLEQIGYQFGTLGGREGDGWAGNQFPIHQPPSLDVISRVNEIEAEIGPLPVSLRAWWEVVGGVNFLGFHPDWPDSLILDPVFIPPLDLNDVRSEHQAWRDNHDDQDDCGQPFTIPIPDEYHKDDVSGGTYDIVVAPAVDTLFLGEWHATTFMDYLRIAFRWAGFPGFERCAVGERPSDELAFLISGLQPF